VTFQQLRVKLNAILEERISRDIFLRADKQVPYGTVIRVMSEAKAAGVDKLGMVTLPPPDKNEPDGNENGTS
jgi:biopolymer transport protein TolR